MRTSRAGLMLIASLAAAVTAVGCAPKTPAGEGGTEGKEYDLIERSANLYWDAVRWADGERSGVFIEDVQQRVLFMDWLEEQREAYRYEDIAIIQIELGPVIEKPVDGRRREATVWVRTRGYALPAQILETDRVKQGWYRTDQGWFVAWERDDTSDGSASAKP